MAEAARDHLRTATEQKHAELDGVLSKSPLDQRAGYARFLWINAQLAALEAALEAAGVTDDLPDWQRRTRREALEADLRALGVQVEPVARSAIDLTSRAARLGLAYVLEGSRLGAVAVGRIVSTSTDSAVRQATRFLRHGEGEGLWRSFLPHLERGLLDPADRATAARAARQGFDAYLARAALEPAT